jgi:hypothetical protein
VLECHIEVGGRTLVAHLPPRGPARSLREGDGVWVELPADAAVLLPWEDARP